MPTSNPNNTALTIAFLSGGAFLLWLLWPGRGKGKGRGQHDGSGGDGDPKSTPVPVFVRILSGDRVELSGVISDLATMVARVRAAGAAEVIAVGDAREGWVITVRDALTDTGAHVEIKTKIPGALVPRNARASHFPGRGVPVRAPTRRRRRHGA